MNLFVVAVVAVTVAALVLLGIALFAPKATTVTSEPIPERRRALSVERITSLLERMGLEIQNVRGAPPEMVEMEAIDPHQPTQDTVLVRCLPVEGGAPAGPEDVEGFVDAVRIAGKNRGLLFTPHRLSPDAVLKAQGTPVTVFDPHATEALEARVATRGVSEQPA